MTTNETSITNTNDRLERLIAALGKDLELTGEEIADIIWLALKGFKSEGTPASSKADIQPPPYRNISQSAPDLLSASPQTTPSSPPVYIYPDIPSRERTSYGTKVLPLRIPNAPSLREPLTLAQALRPLMRRVFSRNKTVLDEVETVKRIAETKIWVPVFKPEPEPWLDIALVVDESKSMVIWRHTIRELKRLLEHYGAFRDVRTWGLKIDENGQVNLRLGIERTANQQRIANPSELIDPSGRRLVLVVSNCVSSMWSDNTVFSALKIWTDSGPMALLQMLPEWLWLRTGLRLGASVRLGSLAPGVANQHLLIKEILLWKQINLDRGIKVPILTLEPEVASTWSQMVSGKNYAITSGFVLPSEFKGNKSKKTQSKINVLADERVYRFRMTASPMARKLAGLLAAAPVINLPVVRLIQETMLPLSRQVHVAEVFLGGLLKPLTSIESKTEPDEVQYDFMDDRIRNIFFESAPVSDSKKVVNAVSKYVASHLGKTSEEFVALLKTPGEAEDERVKPFATIATNILKQLGGNYARFADELVQNSPFSLCLGLSISRREPSAQPGLITCFVRKRDRPDIFLLSVSHVLAPEGQNISIGDPIIIQEGQEEKNTVAILSDFNYSVDAAIARIQSGISIETTKLDESKSLKGFRTVEQIINKLIDTSYLQVFKQGKTTGLTRGRIRDFDLTTSINFTNSHGSLFSRQFENMIAIEGEGEQPFALPSDSGSLVVDKDDYAIAVIIGGTTKGGENDRGLTYAMPIELVLKALELELVLDNRFVYNKLSYFVFEVITINASGQESTRQTKHTSYFTENLGNNIILDMVAIPGGKFLMGAPLSEKDSRDTERPQHQVTIQPFFMGKYPVTQAQWRAIANLPKIDRDLKSEPSEFKGDNRPVERVNWYDAVEFCQRLSKHTRRQYRLPSEAEWEYACRAQTSTPFYFGETITSELANYKGIYTYANGPRGEARSKTIPVEHFGIANAFGLCDMHGNVYEWCQDSWQRNYQGAPTDGSAWLTDDDKAPRVARGGSWGDEPNLCRSAYRGYFNPDENRDFLGFRVVVRAVAADRTIVDSKLLEPINKNEEKQKELPFTIEMTMAGVLLAGKWRTKEELDQMPTEDKRNTLIVEMSEHTNQPVGYFQGFDDDALVGKGAVVVFLRETGICNDETLKDMSDEDQRNTLIEENNARTGRLISQLQVMSNQELVQLGLNWYL